MSTGKTCFDGDRKLSECSHLQTLAYDCGCEIVFASAPSEVHTYLLDVPVLNSSVMEEL